MNYPVRRLTLCAVALLALGTDSALSGAGIPVEIVNDGDDEVVVTLFDLNNGQQVVLSNQRIYGSAKIEVFVAPDGGGYGHVAWTALGGDSDDRTCGHGEGAGLNPYDQVHVAAGDDCDSN